MGGVEGKESDDDKQVYGVVAAIQEWDTGDQYGIGRQ